MSANKDSTASKMDFLSSMGGKTLVQFTRHFEPGSTMGYVLDIGPEFFLLAIVDDSIRYNGFQCLRVKDIRKLRSRSKDAAFPEEALKRRGLQIPTKPRVDLSSIDALLKTAGRAFPVVTIHRERFAADICHIGKVIGVEDGRVSLLEIDPDAVWEEEATQYKLRQITRVDFAGGYEDALVLVGGEAPTSS